MRTHLRVTLLALFVTLGLIGLQPSLSSAQTNIIIGAGGFYAFEKDNDGYNYDVKLPLAARFGYRFAEVDLVSEYSRFKAAQGAPSVEVERLHHEFILWMRQTFKKNWLIAPVIQVGAGVQTDTITTHFEGETREDQGTFRALASASLGARWRVIERLMMVTEGRITFSSNYNPNPLLGAGAFIEWTF